MWVLDDTYPGHQLGGPATMNASSSMQKLLLIIVSLLLIGSAASTYWLSARLGAIENRIGHGDVNSGDVSADPGDPRSAFAMTYPESVGNTRKSPARIAFDATAPGMDGISKAEEIKRDTQYVPPEQLIRSMDRLMVSEPRNPVLEAKQQRRLKDAATATVGDDVPKAQDVSTVCQGHRCVVSAYFSDTGSAQEWAMRYLLISGGRVLPNSRTVIVPGTGGASTSLQLYLF